MLPTVRALGPTARKPVAHGPDGACTKLFRRGYRRIHRAGGLCVCACPWGRAEHKGQKTNEGKGGLHVWVDSQVVVCSRAQKSPHLLRACYIVREKVYIAFRRMAQKSSAMRSLFSIIPAVVPEATAFATVRRRAVLSPQA